MGQIYWANYLKQLWDCKKLICQNFEFFIGPKSNITLNRPKNLIISNWAKLGLYLNGLSHQTLPCQTTMSHTATSAATSDECLVGPKICDSYASS
jgi:hypothetical protein